MDNPSNERRHEVENVRDPPAGPVDTVVGRRYHGDMARRWLPSTLDDLHRRFSADWTEGLSKIGRRETAWFLQEALLEEETLMPPDVERIQKIKDLIKLVDPGG